MQEMLLRAAGFADITPDEARAFALQTGELFDIVSPLCKTAYPFTSDLQAEMRSSVVDGALELIGKGMHRETMFWTCATFCRLMMQSAADAPDIFAAWQRPFCILAQRVGAGTPMQQRKRISDIRMSLPVLRAFCAETVRNDP